MPTPLYTTDVQKIVDRTPKTTLLDTDVFVVADEDGTLAPITKPNVKTTLGISDAESAISTLESEMDSAEGRLDTLEGADTVEGSVAKTVKDAVDGALAVIKGVGWNGETIKGTSDNLDAHLASSMPHVFRNHEKGKNYNFGFRVSNDGHPQIFFEEEV